MAACLDMQRFLEAAKGNYQLLLLISQQYDALAHGDISWLSVLSCWTKIAGCLSTMVSLSFILLLIKLSLGNFT